MPRPMSAAHASECWAAASVNRRKAEQAGDTSRLARRAGQLRPDPRMSTRLRSEDDPSAALPIGLDSAWEAASGDVKLGGKLSESRREEELKPLDRADPSKLLPLWSPARGRERRHGSTAATLVEPDVELTAPILDQVCRFIGHDNSHRARVAPRAREPASKASCAPVSPSEASATLRRPSAFPSGRRIG